MKYEIEKTLVASTSHITKSDKDKLEDEAVTNRVPVLCVYRYEFGFLIYVNPQEKVFADPKVKANYSLHLQDLLLHTKEQGCCYLKLDCDGTVYDHLETFDW